EDSTALVLEFESGTIGTHAHSWAVNQYIAEIAFFSPKLVLKLDYVRNRLHGTLDGKPIDEQYDDDPYFTEAECFTEAVRAQRMDHIRSTYFDAMKTLAVALAGNRSLESGRPEQVKSS
ncbi:MAG: hypothetical protein AABZ61_08030, partial [Bacteroidota bacterium]